jgi:ParB family chromosome partitioning protein
MMEFIDSSVVEQIEMKMVRPSKFAIRDAFRKDDPDFDTLINSIREHGLLQPILIRPLTAGFEIVAGHRRFHACRSLRWRFIPAKIRELTDKQSYEIQLTENVQRKSMDSLEEAEAFRRYIVDFGWGGVTELAKKIGKSEEYVSHHMQLLRLPNEIKEKIADRSMNVSQAIEIAQISHEKQSMIVEHIMSNDLTVRQIRELKNALNQESQDDLVVAAKSKAPVIARKTYLTLKIALTRIDNLINEVHSTVEPDQRAEIIGFLMGIRLKVHSLIDDSIRFRDNSAKQHKH